MSTGHWIGALVATLRRVVRPQSTRIVIRAEQDIFIASLVSRRFKTPCSVIWKESEGSWQPEAMMKHLQHIAQENCVDLEVPGETVLSQCIKLPKAALSNLPEAIIYGLPAWSPFQAKDVYVAGSLEGIREEQAFVRLSYVLRERANTLIERFAVTGFHADRIVLDAASNSFVSLSTPKLARMVRARRIDGIFALTAFILFMTLGFTHIAMMSRKIDDLQVRLRAELTEQRRFEALKANYDSYIARRSAVSRKRATEPTTYELLVALAHHLPEGILIQTLETGNGRGRLELSVPNPERVLQGLKAIPFIRSFKIEDTRSPQNSIVSFEIAGKQP